MWVRSSIPASANDSASSSPANGSMRLSRRSPRTSTVVERAPSPCMACAISHATTPPPITTRRSGTDVVAVTSWLVHGRASARPGVGGIAATLPVARTTAWRAVITRSLPSSAVTRTRLGPSRRPLPRKNSAGTLSIQRTWPLSSKFDTVSSRLASTAATSIGPSESPGTRRTSPARSTGRSSALLGTHAQ